MAKNHALCIGINDYPGVGSDLRGCVNDANDWRQVLEARGFEVLTLLDAQATKSSMAAEMKAVLERARGACAVITYSGHGTWVPDDDGDEVDARDEALCPYDLGTAGPLLDDELYRIFTGAQHGTRVVFISDSCHSGTVARVAKPLADPQCAPRNRYLPPAVYETHPDRLARALRVERAGTRGKSRQSVLQMSGCRDSQTSADAYLGGRFCGAFSSVALTALASLRTDATYAEWHALIREQLPSQDFEQVPQLVGTRTQRAWKVFA